MNCGVLLQHASHVLAERKIVAQQFNIIVGEADLHTGLVAAGLLRGAARENANGRRAEALEDHFNGLAKSVPVGKKKNDGGDAPGHPGHSEQGLSQVVPHCVIRLRQKVAIHKLFLAECLHGFEQGGTASWVEPGRDPGDSEGNHGQRRS